MKALLLGLVLALASVAGIVPSASAHATHGRHIEGIIQKVDLPSHQVELTGKANTRPLHLTWNEHTTFTVGARLADAGILKPGAKVAVVYYDPLFGRPVLAKVRLMAPL